jgi:hypothetical protein
MQSIILSLIWYLVEANIILEDKKYLEEYFKEWGQLEWTDIYYDKNRFKSVIELIKTLYDRDIIPKLEEELKSDPYDLVDWGTNKMQKLKRK